MISICNTDEHYPPLFNQRYLEDNIGIIQKKQCHVRQKRRLLQLDTINSISIDKDNRLYNLLDENVIKEQNQGNLQVLNGIVEFEQSLRPQPVTKQKVKCNCKKTKCLKLYCDCFNQGEFCSAECNCNDCSNTAAHKEERDAAMNVLKERNPDAFKPKVQTKEVTNNKLTSQFPLPHYQLYPLPHHFLGRREESKVILQQFRFQLKSIAKG